MQNNRGRLVSMSWKNFQFGREKKSRPLPVWKERKDRGLEGGGKDAGYTYK